MTHVWTQTYAVRGHSPCAVTHVWTQTYAVRSIRRRAHRAAAQDARGYASASQLHCLLIIITSRGGLVLSILIFRVATLVIGAIVCKRRHLAVLALVALQQLLVGRLVASFILVDADEGGEEARLRLRVPIRQVAAERERLLGIRLVRQVRAHLLEERDVQRNLRAQRVNEFELVDEPNLILE